MLDLLQKFVDYCFEPFLDDSLPDYRFLFSIFGILFIPILGIITFICGFVQGFRESKEEDELNNRNK